MTVVDESGIDLHCADRFFIDGRWVTPSTSAMFDVENPATEMLLYQVAEATSDDVSRAVDAARRAFDTGPWPTMTHSARAEFLRSMGQGLTDRADELGRIWSSQAGILYSIARFAGPGVANTFEYYAAMVDEFEFIERHEPTLGGKAGFLVREPVGVVGAIIPWNAPLGFIGSKVAPALIAGCCVVLKASPEAPGECHVLAEIAEEAGLPPGVLNVVTADRAASEDLVRDPRVDKITFTGSTGAGRRIAALCGERIARVTLELGGKSAAVILDDFDIETAAATLGPRSCFLTGQTCASLTRIIVNRRRHDELAEALAASVANVRIGDPFDPATEMGPLAMRRQRDRVEGFIAMGLDEGARLVAGGGRPPDFDRGYFIEPTVFGNVDNASTLAREEIFGPVLSVIAADGEQHAIELANDSIYGLNASVFTNDADRAFDVARQLRTGTVGHNSVRSDFGIAFGGFKQSGIGREGGREGLLSFLETKTIILEDEPLLEERPH